jgi:hypothetical protein
MQYMSKCQRLGTGADMALTRCLACLHGKAWVKFELLSTRK